MAGPERHVTNFEPGTRLWRHDDDPSWQKECEHYLDLFLFPSSDLSAMLTVGNSGFVGNVRFAHTPKDSRM